ncbi:MAG: hypothetical protein QM535_18895 [Limnohabitans sp.]|nr:hypothetical protein [Limnohabitans sp.]
MDINIIVENQNFKILIGKLLLDKLNKNSIQIGIIEVKQDVEKKERAKLIKDSSFIKIEITQNFILNHFESNSTDYNLFVNELKSIFTFFSNKSDEIIDTYDNFSSISIVFNYKNWRLYFPFNFRSSLYLEAFTNCLNFLLSIIKKDNKVLEKALKINFDEGDGERVFSFEKKKWTLINPLNEIAKNLNSKYQKNKDSRIKKPRIIVNQDNIWKYFIFDQNWVLIFDNLETMMIQPNDVSIYSSISEKNLVEAEKFYKENILPRHKRYHGSFPSEKTQGNYFDYFELIIQAIIFSYTSLEAFANICIPNNYFHKTEKEGIQTFYSKEAIEKKFPLRDKFKIILKNILQTPDVSKTNWWNTFIKLEDLRNEIIHSKPSKSENRYSKLLEKEIFDQIKVHKKIIEYYGKYIIENQNFLLNEFPYNFGYDDVSPTIMTGENFEKAYNSINNIKY